MISLLTGIVLLIFISLVFALFTYDRVRVNSDLGSRVGDYPLNNSEASIIRAHIELHNRGRTVGGIIALIIGIIASIRWSGSLTLVFGFGVPMPENLLVWWLTGVVIGTLFAQVDCLPPRSSAPIRRAVLDARASRPLPGLTRAAFIITAFTVIVGTPPLVIWGNASGIPGVILAVGVLAIVELTQSIITTRPRPTTASAQRVDQHLRWFAGTSLAWLELAGACLAFTTAINAWYTHLHSGFTPPQGVWLAAFFIMEILSWGFGICSIIAIVRSHARPLKNPEPETSEPILAESTHEPFRADS
ncbi:MAG: hypothetical protein FWD55_04115 [Propionibacteriaceae bacterium]|nr:hypothetical protein [Propionibacteriaceae bacterium]